MLRLVKKIRKSAGAEDFDFFSGINYFMAPDRQRSGVFSMSIIRTKEYKKKKLYRSGTQLMGIDKYVILAEYYNISVDYLCGLVDTPRKLHP